ncbi:S-adenosyl-L-methionine-dependent methyltransferase [Cladorrhinum sp. PSN259]|nr:S-adenosyl-L-methionine-dependent methyltransferase [Cladorrhinum sp. PSN259]
MPQHAAMFSDGSVNPKSSGTVGLPRTESVTSVSGTSGRTVLSSHPPSGSESASSQSRPFVVRNGRTYIADPTLPYPLPVDLEELHRQSLKTMLLLELYGKPICAPQFANKPPSRILEVGCGTGFWSMMCHRYYESTGQHKDISFTGLDIVPLAPATGGPAEASKAPSGVPAASDMRPDKDMNWRFVQHDMRKLPFPFPDGSFDLVMVKDLGLATSVVMQQGLVDEYIRLLSPNGTVEIWESDHTLRMLRPHVPETLVPGEGAEEDDGSNSEDEQKSVTTLGAYNITANTPLSAPLNNYLVEYNGWVSRALEARDLFCMPCTVLGPILVQEAEVLKSVGSRRLAIPLSEVRWEREGVGGVVTKDGKSYIESKARKFGKDGMPVGGKALEPGAAAVRRTALTVVVQQIQSMEHILREISGKSQDEWDAWVGKMTNDLVKENGTSWGECLEIGAWWAQKISLEDP